MSGTYPDDWKEIARKVKVDNLWRCERCNHENDRESGHVLTVHHLDGNKSNCERWNLAALCQRCHLSVQARVRMSQDILFPELVSDWFVSHLKGYKQWLTMQDEAATSSGRSIPTPTEYHDGSSPSQTKTVRSPTTTKGTP